MFIEELVCAALYKAKQESRKEAHDTFPYCDYAVNLYLQGGKRAVSA